MREALRGYRIMRIASLALLAFQTAPAARPALPLELSASIALPGVAGRIDHLALDEQHARLFVAALEQGSLESVDLAAKKAGKRAGELHEPQGIVYLAARDEVWVAEGAGGVLSIFRGETLALDARLKLGPDGDGLRFDAATGQVWLGYASGALAAIDAAQRKALSRARLAAHPEGFALESKGARAFVNLPAERGVAVVDRAKQEQVAFWPVESAQANYPIALAEEEQQLFVGCRNPGRLLVLDTRTGKELAALELAGDVDDLWLDRERGRLYASCGEGRLDVFARAQPEGRWQRLASVETRKGARTSLFSAARKQLFLAVPKSGELPAEIRVYDARD